VIDGNYGRVRDLVWPRATHVVWLNYSFALTFSRALRRTFRRVVTGQELHGGNRETLAGVLFDPQAVPYWVIRTYRRRRRQYRQLLLQPEYRHQTALEFRNPAAAEAWLAAINSPLMA